MRAEGESRVVGHVQELVRVRRPGVGPLDSGNEVPQPRAHARPHPECAVDVEPGVRLVGDVGELLEGVEGTRVDVARLHADDRRRVATEERAQGVGTHPPLRVHLGQLDLRGADPEVTERAVECRVPLGSREDADARRALEPVGVHVPAGAGKHVVASREQRGHMSHLAAGHKGRRDAVGQAQQLGQPGARHLLHDCCARAGGVEARVLVPGRRQPVRRDRDRQATADHETEVAAARDPDDARLGGVRERRRRLRPDRSARPAAARRAPRAAPRRWRTSRIGRSPSVSRKSAARPAVRRSSSRSVGSTAPTERQDTQPGLPAASGAGSAGSAGGARSRRGRERRRAGGRGRPRRAR